MNTFYTRDPMSMVRSEFRKETVDEVGQAHRVVFVSDVGGGCLRSRYRCSERGPTDRRRYSFDCCSELVC